MARRIRTVAGRERAPTTIGPPGPADRTVVGPRTRRHEMTARPGPREQPDRFFIGGEWVEPSSDATIDVIDSGTEELYYTIAEAAADDMARAVAARAGTRSTRARGRGSRTPSAPSTSARSAPALAERGDVLGAAVAARVGRALHDRAVRGADRLAARSSRTPRWPTRSRSRRSAPPTGGGEFGLLVREPVGVVGAIIPWNAPRRAHLPQDRPRAARRLHRRAQVVARGAGRGLRRSPRSPRQIGLPPGVLNVVTADREVSELLVRDPRVDKITFTGSTAAGPAHRVAVRRAHRALHARARREVGGGRSSTTWTSRPRRRRSPAPSACSTGQVCSSLTRIVVTQEPPRRARRGARRERSRRSRVGDPFDEKIADGAARRPSASATGSRATSPRASTKARRSRPVAAARRTSTAAGSWSRRCSATSTTRRRSRSEEIFGPVLSVIPADDEQRRGADRQRHDLRPQRVGVHERRRPRPRGRRPAPRPAPSATTRSAPTSAWRSAASSSRASAAKAARKGCCRSSRPRP